MSFYESMMRDARHRRLVVLWRQAHPGSEPSADIMEELRVQAHREVDTELEHKPADDGH